MGHSKISTSKTDFFYLFFRNLAFSLILVFVLAAIVLSLPHSSASSNASTDNLTLSIPVSCTLSAGIKSGEEHTISMVSGKYEANIGKTTLNTTCNDPNGYVVYSIGSSSNTEGNNRLIATNLSADNDIISGTATSGNTSNWAMKLTALDSGIYTPTMDNGYDTYSIVPTTWTKVAHKGPGTTDTTKNSAFTTTYAIYLKSSQPAGTYQGQVKYVMFHPSTAAEPTDTLEHAFALAGKQKINLYDNNGTNSTDSSTGELIGSFYKMQDMETSICESTTLVDEQNTLQLVDIRDNKLYWVTKLQDGHCWMTQNLDLDLDSSVALTSETTDLNDNSLTGAYVRNYSYDAEHRIISWLPDNSTIDFTGTTVTGWQNSNISPYSASKTDDSSTGHASLGNYYNWSATIASSNPSSLTTSTYNNILNNPQNSICPKGWRLPTISNSSNSTVGSTNEFSRLNYLYNGHSTQSDSGLLANPLYFTESGYIYGIGLRLFNTDDPHGFYQSSTVHPSKIYVLMLRHNGVTVGDDWVGASYNYRYTGFSVRCLAR